MDWLKRFLKPNQDNFTLYLIQQGEKAVAITDALQSYLQKSVEKKHEKAKRIEQEADEIQRVLVHELLDTFVTPFDREDIFSLSRALDNFIDYVYDTVEELVIFDIEEPEGVQEMANILSEMASELHLALQRLVDHPGVASEHARRAKACENRIEHLYRLSIAELFSEPEDIHEVMVMLKNREVLRHLSNAADHGDQAADTILDIVVKWS